MTNKPNTLKKQETFLEILRNCMGIISHACEKAGINRSSYYDWIKDDKFKAKVDEIQEESIDFAESKLFELIKGVQLPETKFFQDKGRIISEETVKHYPPDNTSIIFFLKTRAKHRGYIERTEVTGKDGQQLNQVIQVVNEQAKKDLQNIRKVG